MGPQKIACRSGSEGPGRRPWIKITGSPGAYWPVYVGASLAMLLVTTCLVLAVRTLKSPPPAVKKTALLPKSSPSPPEIPNPIKEPAKKEPEKQILPPGEAKGAPPREAAGLEIAMAKPAPVLPLSGPASKTSPQLVSTPPPESQAKVELPIPQKNEIVAREPEPLPKKEILAKSPEPPPKIEPARELKAAGPIVEAALKVPPEGEKADPTCGTTIHFVHSPKVALRDALKEDKLVFVLHVSGNFEDPQFT